eukprot:737910-Amphidinium_carterae.1
MALHACFSALGGLTCPTGGLELLAAPPEPAQGPDPACKAEQDRHGLTTCPLKKEKAERNKPNPLKRTARS